MIASIKEYLRDLIYDKGNDPLSEVLKSVFLIPSYVYGVLVKLHHFFYKVNLLKSHKSQIPVISVGNVTLGGTGKTPFAIMVAERLARAGRKVAVLIRGYGEDEWKMLEDRLQKYGVKIFVGRDRVKSAYEATCYGIDVLILDDGFQHRHLKRDLDIVLLDSTNPFGNRRLFPSGILREPLDSLKRASIIVLTKADRGKENIQRIEEEIERVASGKSVLKAFHNPKDLFDIRNGRSFELAFVNGKKIGILSAICDPSYFRYMVEKIEAAIGVEFTFPDHHPYNTRDLDRIFKECKEKGIDTIVTTEKDSVKLKDLVDSRDDGPQILVLRIELEIIERGEKLDACFDRLHLCYSGQDT